MLSRHLHTPARDRGTPPVPRRSQNGELQPPGSTRGPRIPHVSALGWPVVTLLWLGTLAALVPPSSAHGHGARHSEERSAPATLATSDGEARDTVPPGFEDVPPRVRPTVDALHAADTAELTGRELGTMWTFENPPLEYWQEEYDFRPDSAWLAHVRLASLRFGEICSASFVSPEGLVMTNHHCARECVEAISTPQTDHVETGFYAKERKDEKLCPDLHLDQLVSIEEVTGRVRDAVPAGATAQAGADARRAARDSIAAACEEASGLHCQVVSLYHGGQYQLYRYRRYQPVKLVFAPELQAGFFGGDPDNFTYPRFNLDVAFVRAYRSKGGAPVEPAHFLEWDPDGAGEGELVFVTGSPGSTSRMFTVAQLTYEREFRHPFLIDLLEEQRDFLQRIARISPRAERQVRDRLFSIENSLKAFRGELRGLRDPALMGHKIKWQRDFQEQVRSQEELREEYAGVWSELAGLQAEKLDLRPRVYLNDFEFLGSPLLGVASRLVRVLRYAGASGDDLPEGVTVQQLAEAEERLRGEQLGGSRAQEGQLLAIRLRLADRWLTADAPLLRDVLREGESPEGAARRLAQGTRVDLPGFRRGLLDAGAAALDTVTDPLLRVAASMESRFRDLDGRWRELSAREERLEEQLADALFAAFGTDLPPDATFTLRISDGEIRRYEYNGTFAPARTSIYGLYERAENFAGEMPWTLPESFAGARDTVDMSKALNFVSTADITGGNSGSPVLDRQGRVVGVAFDGNIEQLPNEYLFRTGGARTVSVHTAGITEALRSVYGAERLLEELMGGGGRERGDGG